MVGELAKADLFEVLVEVTGEVFGEFEVVLHGVLSPFCGALMENGCSGDEPMQPLIFFLVLFYEMAHNSWPHFQWLLCVGGDWVAEISTGLGA
jgi:hypothetical protein